MSGKVELGKYRFKFGKLVRDKKQSILESLGIDVKSRTLDDKEAIDAIKNKLVEEVNEFIAIDHDNKEKLIDELVDIMDSIQVIADVLKLDQASIEKLHKEKLAKLGTYSNQYIEYIEMNSDHPRVEHYKKKKYTELPID